MARRSRYVTHTQSTNRYICTQTLLINQNNGLRNSDIQIEALQQARDADIVSIFLTINTGRHA